MSRLNYVKWRIQSYIRDFGQFLEEALGPLRLGKLARNPPPPPPKKKKNKKNLEICYSAFLVN